MPDFLADALTWPSNYAHLLGVETAYKLGVPPTLMILDSRTTGTEWTKSDKKLAMAWTILQRETCRECGQPLWICRSDNKSLTFSIRTDTCYAKAALDKWGESKQGKNLKKGEAPYVVPNMRSEEPLPSRRSYLERLAED